MPTQRSQTFLGRIVLTTTRLLKDGRFVGQLGPLVAVGAVLASSPEPTPIRWFSMLISIVAVYGVVRFGCMAHWRLIALHASLVFFVSTSAIVQAFVITSVIVQALLVSRGRSTPHAKRLALAFNFVLILNIRDESIELGSHLLLVSCLAISLIGFLGETSQKQRMKRLCLVLGGSVLLALVGLGISAAVAHQSLRNGKLSAEAALAALKVGDIDQARSLLNYSNENLTDAGNWLDSPLTYPSRFVPGLGYNTVTLVKTLRATIDALTVIEAELSRIDLGSLKIVDGRLDLDAVASLRSPLTRSLTAIRELRGQLNAIRSPWNVEPLEEYLDGLEVELEDQIRQGENALTAIELAPNLFGVDIPRVYFIALTTPVEARGHGGFMGSWVELTVDSGTLSVTDYGRSTDLNESGSAVRFVSGPQDWLDVYGDFGFTTGPEGGISDTAWQNITMSPYFQSTGRVIADLYPQSGGRKLDGVFAMDVKTLSSLLEFSGPVDVEGLPMPLTTSNAEEFLLFGQYAEMPTNSRIDLLEQVTRSTIDQILDGELPPPNIIANRLGPMVAQGRLTAFSTDPKVQEFLTKIQMTGDFSCDEADGCFMLVADNASGSKIDYFLEIRSTLELRFEKSLDTVVAKVKLYVTNSAPSSGLPSYIIGNMVDLPLGYNRTLLSIHTSWFLSPDQTPDGNGWGARNEQGLNVYSSYLDLAPGETQIVELVFKGKLGTEGEYKVATKVPAAARRWTSRFAVETSDGLGQVSEITEPGIKVIDFVTG